MPAKTIWTILAAILWGVVIGLALIALVLVLAIG